MDKIRKQDFLIELVRSLSPSEVRYFKLYGSIQPGEKKYIDLFDQIEKGINATGDLCKALNVTPAYLAVLKHYLYQMLMRSLRNYEEQASYVAAINNSKEDALLLLRRRLHEHAFDVIEKTLAKALELEVFEVIDDLLFMKMQCLYNLRQTEGIDAILAEHKKIGIIQSELLEMERLTVQSVKLEGERRNQKDLEKLCNHPLIKRQPGHLKSLRAQVRWFHVRFGSQLTPNNSEMLKLARQEYEHYRKNEKVKQINAPAYVINLTRIANAEAENDNFAEALLFSDKANKALNDTSLEISKARRDSILAFNQFFRVYVLLRMQDFKAAVIQSKAIEELMQTRPDNERYSSVFYYAIALLHLGQNKPAIDKINDLLLLKTEARIDLQQYTRMLLIIVQYDAGNYQLIPYLVKSAKSWMKRNKQKNAEFDLFFKHILSAAKSSLPVREKALRQLSNAAAQGKLAELDRTVFLKRWLDSKGITP